MAAADIAARVGARVLAPVLAVWVQAVSDVLAQQPALVPLALMRDGALLGQAVNRHFDTMVNRHFDTTVNRRLNGTVAQAWLSRRLTATAAIADGDDHENLLNLLVRMRHRPARWDEAAVALGLPPPPDDVATQPLSEPQYPRFWEWLARRPVADALQTHVGRVRGGVLAHLDSLGIAADAPLLLLDVGYAASVQRCLKRIFALTGRKRAVHGVYLVTSAGARWAMSGEGRVIGVLAELGEPRAFADTLLRHRDVLECLLAQPMGELLGHDAAGGAITAPSPLPSPQLLQVAAAQSAALAAMQDDDTTPDTARTALTRLFLHPDPAEARTLGAWRHADSTALDGLRPLAAGPPDGDRAAVLWPAAARLCRDISA